MRDTEVSKREGKRPQKRQSIRLRVKRVESEFLENLVKRERSESNRFA